MWSFCGSCSRRMNKSSPIAELKTEMSNTPSSLKAFHSSGSGGSERPAQCFKATNTSSPRLKGSSDFRFPDFSSVIIGISSKKPTAAFRTVVTILVIIKVISCSDAMLSTLVDFTLCKFSPLKCGTSVCLRNHTRRCLEQQRTFLHAKPRQIK